MQQGEGLSEKTQSRRRRGGKKAREDAPFSGEEWVCVSLCYRLQLHCSDAAKVSEGRRGDVRLRPEVSCSGAVAWTSLCNKYRGTFSLWWNYCRLFLFLTGYVELHPCLKSCWTLSSPVTAGNGTALFSWSSLVSLVWWFQLASVVKVMEIACPWMPPSLETELEVVQQGRYNHDFLSSQS